MKRASILLHLLFPTVFVVVVLLIAPLKEVFEYDADEGVNAMKALLYLKGFSLYDEIWSDQPPLLTYILSYWFNLFGLSVYQGRLLILIFSAILLWAFYQIIRSSWGHFCALLAVVFLLLSAHYLRLSISIMVGLPALTFAMLSIYGLILYRKFCLKRWLLLSGTFMALSLQTKLFTIFLVPIIIFGILQIEWTNFKSEKRVNHLFFPALLWFGTLLTVYLGIALLFFPENVYQQLLQPHLEAKKMMVPLMEFNSFLVIREMIVQDYDIALMALAGTVMLIRQKKWHSLFPFAWFILVFILLLEHKPIWYHYYLLLSIPLAWLAAICLSEFFRIDIRYGWFPKMGDRNTADTFLRWLTAGIVVLLILMLPSKFQRVYTSLTGKTFTQDRYVVELLLKYSPDTKWVVTDRQIFPFYANLPVPPELAVTSIKRMVTGNLTTDYFMKVLQKYRPEQILFKRFQGYPPEIMSYIRKNYSKVYHHKDTRHYILKEIIEETSDNLEKQ